MTTPDLPLLTDLLGLIDEGAPLLEARVVCTVQAGAARFPVHALTLGNPSPEVPAIGFFGGVHGLERIGAEVVIAWLRSLVKRLAWDEGLHEQLKKVRLVFMPLVNPGGLWLGTAGQSERRGPDAQRSRRRALRRCRSWSAASGSAAACRVPRRRGRADGARRPPRCASSSKANC